jgi:hypothetical protein
MGVLFNVIVLLIAIIITVIVTLKVQSRRRNIDGHIVIYENQNGKKVFSLELAKNPDDLENEEFIVFKVVEESEPDDVAE